MNRMRFCLMSSSALLVLGLFSTGAAAGEVAVFPLEGVNVDEQAAVAAGMMLATEVQKRRYQVTDRHAVEQAIRARSFEETMPGPTEQKPGDEPETDPSGEPAEEAPQEGAAESAPEDRSAMEIEIARELACDYYITGMLIRLGERVDLHVEMRAPDGKLVASQKMSSRTEAGLPRVIPRLVELLISEVDPSSSSTPHAPPYPVRGGKAPRPMPVEEDDLDFEKNFGVALGQTFGIKDTFTYLTINFDGRLEFNRLLLGLNAGINLGNGSESVRDGLQFNLDISMAGYLTETPVAPFLGAGAGIFIGNRIPEEEEEEHSPVGWNLFPLFGVEFTRNRSMRVHLDVRYLFNFVYGVWGHGPMAMIGVAF